MGPQLYHVFSSKDLFARQMLVERGMDPELTGTDRLPVGEAFRKLVEFTGEAPEALTRVLYQTHHVGTTWYIFAAVGVVSAAMIWAYGRWLRRLAAAERRRQDGAP